MVWSSVRPIDGSDEEWPVVGYDGCPSLPGMTLTRAVVGDEVTWAVESPVPARYHGQPGETYRFLLFRRWDHTKPLVGWVLLNPSSASATKPDPTFRRVIAFSKKWGFGGAQVVNAYALRNKDPRIVLAHAGRSGGIENDMHIARVARKADAVVLAWGTNVEAAREGQLFGILRKHRPALFCLGRSQHGYPLHPLYQPADRELHPWQY
jgi:hypothetical protein